MVRFAVGAPCLAYEETERQVVKASEVHLGNGWVFSAPNGGWEYPAFLAMASLVQALLGDGAYAWKPVAFRRLATA